MGNSVKDEDWKQTSFFHSVLNIEKQECTHKQTKPCMTQGCILHQDGRNVVTKMAGPKKNHFPWEINRSIYTYHSYPLTNRKETDQLL